MKLSRSVLLAAFVILAISGCTEDTPDNGEAAGSTANPMPIKHTPFNDLQRFNGMPPWDLVKDKVIGKEIRAIVPRSELTCMDDIFNYMRDLELDKDGSVSATMNGSHADNFMEASVKVRPTGSITIVLQCVKEYELSSSPKRYQIFTNENIRAVNPSTVEGIYDAGEGDIVAISNGKEKIEARFEKFEQPITPANVTPQEIKSTAARETITASKNAVEAEVPAPTRKPQVGQLYVNAGATICGDLYSMNKVKAIAAAGNPYVPLPDECVVMQRSAPTRILRESTSIPGTVIIEAGNSAALVDRNDLSFH